MMVPSARRELGGGARQHSGFNNCGEGGALTMMAVVSRARGAAPMMVPSARRELGGGARQHSGFNNCGEGGQR